MKQRVEIKSGRKFVEEYVGAPTEVAKWLKIHPNIKDADLSVHISDFEELTDKFSSKWRKLFPYQFNAMESWLIALVLSELACIVGLCIYAFNK